jgi:hypothetical protein
VPIGTTRVKGCAKVRCSHCAATEADLGVEHDVEVGFGQPCQVVRVGTGGRGDTHLDAQALEQARISLTSSRWRKPSAVGPRMLQRGRMAFGAGRARRCRGRGVRAGERAHDAVEGFGGAPVLLALVGRQLERDHRHRQVQGRGEAGRIVLDQLGRARRADQQRLRLEALAGLARGGLEQLGGVAAEVARLEGGVGDRRALVAAARSS